MIVTCPTADCPNWNTPITVPETDGNGDPIIAVICGPCNTLIAEVEEL